MKIALVSAAAVLSLALAGLVQAQTPEKSAPTAAPADPNPGHLKMALVSMKCLYSDGPDAAGNKANIQANVKRHAQFIDMAAAQGAEFVGFPELSLNGYHFSNRMTWLSLDGTDQKNLQALAANGARIIYGPHANTTGGTTAGWYKFRAAWGGPNGWIAQLKIYAALHNHAGLYDPKLNPPAGKDSSTGFASGAWFIGPDGKTLAQMPSSTQRSDSREYVLIYNIPTASPEGPGSGRMVD